MQERDMSNHNDYKRIIQRYKDNGVMLWTKGDKLYFKAQRESLTEDQVDFLKQNKEKLIEVLNQQQVNEFALTDIQSAYLIGRMESFDYGGVSCKIYLEMEYDKLDPEKTNRIWNDLINRHEMLRSIIREDGYQIIQSEAPNFKVDYLDLSKERDFGNEKLERIRKEKGNKIFEIGNWPFFDIAISKLTDKSIMHITFDFLVADWASIWILLDEFEVLYKNPDAELEKIELTFQNYLELENEIKNSKKYLESRKYWMDRLDSIPIQPLLPILDKDKVEAEFNRLFFEMNEEEWSVLKEAALKHGCTPTVVVMSVYALCLAKWSQNQEFCLNLTLLNRQPLHKDINKIVGDFTSVNLLEVNVTDSKQFINHAKNIQSQLFKDLDHRAFSGIKVLREITRKRGKEAGLFPYVFTSSIGVLESKTMAGKIGEYGISQTPQVFIDCQAMDNQHGLRINWDIRKGVFSDVVIEDMFASFKAALFSLIERESAWEEKDLILIPERQVKKRKMVNDTHLVLKQEALHVPVFEQIRNKSNNIAIIQGYDKTTYEELGNMATQIALALREEGCSKGDKVGVIIHKGASQIASVLGVLMLGAVYVPIDDKQPINRINTIIDHTDIEYLLTLTSFEVSEVKAEKIICVDTFDKNSIKETKQLEVYHNNIDDLAYIIFTSGSTGAPKGVQITHGAANNTIKDINMKFNVNESDRVLAISKLSFDLSVYDIFGLLSVGGTVVFPDEELYLDPSHWYELINKHCITLWNTVPALMQILLAFLHRKEIKNIPLRLALISGDWVPVTMPKEIWKYSQQAEVVALGGATEASIWSNYYICKKDDEYSQSIPYGYPLANQEYRVLNPKMEDCPDWVLGELYILGKGVGVGYINDDEATQKQFIIDPSTDKPAYKTGDYGYYLSSGEIIFSGRKDQQVKIRGHRIELGEIEAALNRHHLIANASVILCGEESNNIFAAVRVEGELSGEEIQNYLRKNLPDYMLPSLIKIVDQIPLTKNGKVDRKKIEEYYEEQLNESKKSCEDTSTQHELEEIMIQMLQELIGVANITPLTNVYHIGADSLILAQFIGKLKDYLEEKHPKTTFSYDSLLRQILNEPTINKLYDFIKENLMDSTSEIDNASKHKKERHIGLLSDLGGGKEGPTRLVFHAALGTMNCLKYILKELDQQQLGPVIGITVQNGEKYFDIEAEDLIEYIAEDYSQQIVDKGIKEVQLIGYCMGGLIAIEVAKRLIEADINIVDFTLIDSAPVNFNMSPSIALELIFITNFYITVEDVYCGITNKELMDAIIYALNKKNLSLTEEDLLNIDEYEEYQEAFKFLKEFSNIPIEQRFHDYVNAIYKVTGEKVPPEIMEGNYKTFFHSFKASKLNTLAYFGDIRFMEATEPMDFMFKYTSEMASVWRDICVGEFEVIPIKGNHITCIEEEENAREVAELLAKPLINVDCLNL